MATLTRPKLQIKVETSSSDALVTASVMVRLTNFEKAIMASGLKFRLMCELWSDDDFLNGGDDMLTTFPRKTVSSDGTFTFTRLVSRAKLDEDSDGSDDDIYAKFTLQSSEELFPLSKSIDSPIVKGSF